jgi:rhodanese-related sulfurtransferase
MHRAHPDGGIPAVSVQEAAAHLDDGSSAVLVDVREVHEYVSLRVADTLLVPLSELVARLPDVPRDRPLMLLCRSGARSGRATLFLLQQGFLDVRNVAGGMIAWQAAGLPTRSGPLEPGEGEPPRRP